MVGQWEGGLWEKRVPEVGPTGGGLAVTRIDGDDGDDGDVQKV